ncbi:hypothetical protein QA645_26730 [Bradyrhizobium sp. CIAT3101]|uniref:hypothetical protein n=1 Tax=Bradyrhizobium sp. CIAT3101 TaxID=439387 RepID=UPI0024B16E72|nr:hypothetical protein [Bradyrhizobium sp. CIAT3101]WFU78132.1 hypothetical protein QA645_26730 [Bradyrhizobium sp. CIAT3101]
MFIVDENSAAPRANFGLFDHHLLPLFCPTGQAQLHPLAMTVGQAVANRETTSFPASTVHGVVLRISCSAPDAPPKKKPGLASEAGLFGLTVCSKISRGCASGS